MTNSNFSPENHSRPFNPGSQSGICARYEIGAAKLATITFGYDAARPKCAFFRCDTRGVGGCLFCLLGYCVECSRRPSGNRRLDCPYNPYKSFDLVWTIAYRLTCKLTERLGTELFVLLQRTCPPFLSDFVYFVPICQASDLR